MEWETTTGRDFILQLLWGRAGERKYLPASLSPCVGINALACVDNYRIGDLEPDMRWRRCGELRPCCHNYDRVSVCCGIECRVGIRKFREGHERVTDRHWIIDSHLGAEFMQTCGDAQCGRIANIGRSRV